MSKREREGEAQYIEEKSETEKIVRNSPYGSARSNYGWGTPFKSCMKCAIAGFPNIHIGISSLNGVPSKAREMPIMMQQYLKKFTALEHCNPYHRMNDPASWTQWRGMVDKRPDFVYTIKANQFLTHTRMLEMDDDTATHIDHFFRERCLLLKPHLGSVLIQLPPQFRMTMPHVERLKAVAARIAPTGVECAVEFRHRSWFCEEVYAVLREIGWTLVATHNEDVGESPIVDTGSNVMYVRLHGAVGHHVGDYGPVLMKRWAEECLKFVQADRTRRVYFFLNNNESQIGGLTSSIVDATCLAETINSIIAKSGGAASENSSSPPKNSTSVEAPGAPGAVVAPVIAAPACVVEDLSDGEVS